MHGLCISNAAHPPQMGSVWISWHPSHHVRCSGVHIVAWWPPHLWRWPVGGGGCPYFSRYQSLSAVGCHTVAALCLL